MITKVKQAVENYNMLSAGSEVTVALSGGADSVALLYAMKELGGLRLRAAHLNHMLRGEEADRDEEFCQELCKRLEIPLITERIDIAEIAEKTGESIELCARKQRYAFFERAAAGGIIATAHTADDNLETVIFNLARGTGLSGLCGIPPVRDNIVRPLIYCQRAEIEEYLSKKGQAFCTDSSNSQDAYTRNYIRHNISPLLERLNPAVKQNAVLMCEGLRYDSEYIKSSAAELIKDKTALVQDIAKAPKSLGMAAISMLCRESLGFSPERKTAWAVYELCQKGEGKYNLEGNSFAEIKKGRLYFYKPQVPEAFSYSLSEVLGKSIKGYEFSVISAEEYKNLSNVNKKFLISGADCDKIPLTARVTGYRSGCSMRIAGRNCTKSIGKLLNECGVPEWEKPNVIMVEDGDSILMVCPYGVAESVKLDRNTKRVLLVKRNEE